MGEQITALILLMILATSVLSMFVLAVPFIQISKAEADFTAKNRLTAFLSEVIGLDLTRYNVTESSGFSYPSEYGGLVKQEVVSFHLEILVVE